MCLLVIALRACMHGWQQLPAGWLLLCMAAAQPGEAACSCCILLRQLSIPSTLHLLIPTLVPAISLPCPPLPQFLENVLHAPPALAELRTVDEAVVIGAALSLSSSAFVLQLLRERGELDSRVGQATLGILLLQDIATVPFLVLLPLIEGNNSGECGWLGGIWVGWL
jgi:hypothetical protein